jgi:hypothetical protein
MPNQSCDHRPADWLDNSKHTITQQKLHGNISGTGQISGQHRFTNKLNQSKKALAYTARAPGLSS